jgi:hypothetical protein
MRESTYRAIKDAVRMVVSEYFQQADSSAEGRLKVLTDHVKAVEPVSVELDQSLADRIVEKIHGPMTISKEFSAWLAKNAEFHDVYWTAHLGYGPDCGQVEYRIKTNGTLYMQIADLNGAILWRGTFVPPDFGKQETS